MWVGAPSVFWILDSGFWIPSSLGSVTHILGEPCGSALRTLEHSSPPYPMLYSAMKVANPVCELSACASKSTRSLRRLPHAALGDGEVARIGAALVWHLLASLQAQATSCVREVVLGVAARALALEEAHLLDQTFGGEQRCGGVVF